MTITTTLFNAADYIETPEDAVAFLDDALATGDAAYIQHALGVLAKSKGMSKIAEQAGVNRQGLYKALAPDGAPQFDTILKVVKALGLQLSVKAPDAAAA